jgi:hypothetical protein
MKIRITKAFSGYRIGQEFDWADGMARIYIGRGMAEPVADDDEDVVEEQMVEPKVERATVSAKRKQK